MVSKKTDSCLGRIISRYKFNEFSVSLPSRMGKRKYDFCESEQADDIRSFCNEIIKTLVDAVPRRVGCDQKDCYDFNEAEYGYEVIGKLIGNDPAPKSLLQLCAKPLQLESSLSSNNDSKKLSSLSSENSFVDNYEKTADFSKSDCSVIRSTVMENSSLDQDETLIGIFQEVYKDIGLEMDSTSSKNVEKFSEEDNMKLEGILEEVISCISNDEMHAESERGSIVGDNQQMTNDYALAETTGDYTHDIFNVSNESRIKSPSSVQVKKKLSA